jgi:proline racemase
LIKTLNWQPPSDWSVIRTVDMHTGGEALRILIDGLPEIMGDTILEKRRYFRDNLDYIRTGTMFEPRGHADMYGAIITEPVTEDGDFGVFFMHNEGYSTMCGHAIIALTKFVIETGLIDRGGEEIILKIDGPAGRIVSTAFIENGSIVRIVFRNVPSFVLIPEAKVHIKELGQVNFSIAFGGAFYAFVDADAYGIELISSNSDRIISLGSLIKKEVADNFEIKHPFEKDMGFLYGTIFTGKAENNNSHSRNVCIFANGELDRSATGSGVSARAAIHSNNDELPVGEWIEIESIIGSTMRVRVAELTEFGPHLAVIPEIEGTAHFTGRSDFWFDPGDPLKNGFILRG